MSSRTNQERLRASVKFRVVRMLWICAGRLKQCFGDCIVRWSVAADHADYPLPGDTE